MKTLLIIFLSFFKLASGFALEADTARISRLEREVEDLQERLCELLAERANPSANPSILGDVYFVTFNALHWYARTNGTAFAYSNHLASANTPVRGRTKDLKFNWEWGLRVEIGKNLSYDQWDLCMAFTLFRPHFSGAASAGMNTALIPLKGSANMCFEVTHAKSTYALDTYQIDLELGHHYFSSSKLSLRPFAGLKNVWIGEQQIIRYTGGSIGHNTAHVEDKSDFWGMGFRGGLNAKWHLCEGFYLSGLFSSALLYGFFDIDHREKLTLNPHNTIQLDDNKHRFIPTVQWGMGMGWSGRLNEGKCHFRIQISYEGMYWWRLNQMLKIYECSSLRYDNFGEDLSMHGITLMAQCHY